VIGLAGTEHAGTRCLEEVHLLVGPGLCLVSRTKSNLSWSCNGAMLVMAPD
jgi:hypothetical protein